MPQYELLPFSQIKDRLPKDSWARALNELKDGAFEDETVKVYRGDTTLPELDLDFPTEEGAETFFMVLVEGDLTVESWIGNEETDGAIGLIVNGNLKVRNALLGGQEVHVTGDVEVEELLWGDYSHGSMTVCGTISAALCIDTDEYHFFFREPRGIRRRLTSGDPDGGELYLMDEQAMSELLDPDCLSQNADDTEVLLHRGAMLDMLRAGQPVVRMEGIEQAPMAIPSMFEQRDVSLENILKVTDPSRMVHDPDYPNITDFSFQVGEDVSVQAGIQKSARRFVRLWNDRQVLFISANWEEERRSLFGKLTGAAVTGRWDISAMGKDVQAGDGEWHHFEDPNPLSGEVLSLPPEYQRLLETGWNALLDGVSTYDYARTLINPDEVRRLLALPVVAPYDDFTDDDRYGFWLGDIECAFSQEGASFGDEPLPPKLRLIRECVDAEGTERNQTWFFTIHRQVDGTESVFIEYKSHFDSDDDRVPASFLGGRPLQLATLMFRVGRRQLDLANDALIERGEVPHCGDAFALQHWRDKGYLAAADTVQEVDEDPQDSPFSAVQPRHILCILGATHDLQPLRDVVTAVSKAGEYAEGFNIDGDYSQEEPDDRMVASFDICRDRVEPGAWTEADAQAVADHQSVLYVLSPPMTQDNSVAFSMAALMLIDDLLDAGAVAIKAESAGAAHGVQRWRDLVAEAAAAVASDDQLEQRRIARLAFAKRPLSSEAYFESVGFHLVGLPDVHVAQLAGDEWQAIAIMDSIADEIAAQGLAASLESRGARLTRDMNHEEDSFKFNPYGIVKYGA